MLILKNLVNPVYVYFFAPRQPFRYTLALSLGPDFFPEGGEICLTFPRAAHPSKSEPS